jgi:hypothetical protein
MKYFLRISVSRFFKKFILLYGFEVLLSFSQLPLFDLILGQVNKVRTLNHITYLRCTFNVLASSTPTSFKRILATRFPVKICMHSLFSQTHYKFAHLSILNLINLRVKIMGSVVTDT